MSSVDEAKARFERIRQRDAERASAIADDPQVPAERESPKDVRHTVDLTWARHSELARWRLEAAIQLGRPKLSDQLVLSRLVKLLLVDETVSRRLRALLDSGEA